MRYYFRYCFVLLLLSVASVAEAQKGKNVIDLSGTWRFAMDSMDVGVGERWFSRKLYDSIRLPGSMTTNNKGNDVSISTQWTGGIADSSWFKKPEYAAYRQPGNIKIPFWLQPVKYYKGAAWYQKTITIPASWSDREVQLFIERSHWETTLWIDSTEVGMQNSLGTPHIFSLPKLSAGRHQITIRVDNRIKELNVGPNSHSITDHTQSNWNGIIGKLEVIAKPLLSLNEVQVFPDLQNKQISVSITSVNHGELSSRALLTVTARSYAARAEKLKPFSEEITLNGDTTVTTIVYSMGKEPLLWDEFSPNLYQLEVSLKGPSGIDVKRTIFGMRAFTAKGTQFTINGRPVFLRGTLECAIFPQTGYPPTDVASWLRILNAARGFGMNHIRFHSWCPPEAAFDAADQLGFYLQVECSSWANQGSAVGDGRPVDGWLYEESNRMAKMYGNHPSYTMLTYGNEPAGSKQVAYLTNFVKYWQQKDPRRLYTTAAGWPMSKESDYNNDIDPRIQGWGAELKSIINAQPPRTNFDFASIISRWSHPTVSHEVGQWCVYPDLKEIKKYTGVLKAKNFEIFRDRLTQNGLLHLADSFLLASGKLQTLCYKADIEAALRTKGFGGFQLLDLHDFPGQGTALVGVLNPFWEEKGYVTGNEFRKFNNVVVPLARFPKMVYQNNDTLKVPVEVAQFSAGLMKHVTPAWSVKNEDGKTLFEGSFKATDIPVDNAFPLGTIELPLSKIRTPSRLIVTVSVGPYQNTWDIFVYPGTLPAAPADILVTQRLDEHALKALHNGGKVLLTLKKGSIRKEMGGNVAVGFSSIFWNTAWTNGHAPHTLGILCNPEHPALKEFPTQYHSNWQWWDAMSHSNVFIPDSLASNLKPVVRVIDDWFTARPLGIVAECRVGKGMLMLSGIDLLTDADKRPEARQLLHSLLSYMSSTQFNPAVTVPLEKLKGLLN